MAPYAIELPPRRAGRGHFDQDRKLVPEAEKVCRGEMRDDRSPAAGQYR